MSDFEYPFNLGLDNEGDSELDLLQFTHSNPDTLRWLRRGLVWYYGFHHEEAVICFQRALAIEPDCSMAHWGVSVSNGPNYNSPAMLRDDFPSAKMAYNHAQQAKLCLSRTTVSQLEIDLVEALQVRFNPLSEMDDGNPVEQNTKEYADAVKVLYQKYSDNCCIACMYAEALMNFAPWELWNLDTGFPTEQANVAKTVIDTALALCESRKKQHPGLHHFKIHLMEMSPTPEAALPSCIVLDSLCPDAGHLVHMPSHIYVLLGMWKEAMDSNIAAEAVDQKCLQKDGIYNGYTGYRIHNIHFISYASMFSGHYSNALKYAKQLRRELPDDLVSSPYFGKYYESFRSVDIHVYIRFGKWNEILALPIPTDVKIEPYAIALAYYARGIAHAALGNVPAALIEQSQLNNAWNNVPEEYTMHNNTCRKMLDVGKAMLEGEIKYRSGDYVAAFSSLEEAVALSDALVYDEPWGWMVPPRHALGALLLEQGHYARAEGHFRKDMDRSFYGRCHPENVWAVSGLVRCLEMRMRHEEGKKTELSTGDEEKTTMGSSTSLGVGSTTTASGCGCKNTNQDSKTNGNHISVDYKSDLGKEIFNLKEKLRELLLSADHDISVACLCARTV